MDDLIDADFGKHDYDWLLTPPETPPVPSSGGKDQQITLTVSRGGSTRSVSTARASRVSTPQLQNGRSTKLVRSSSVTRPSILGTCSSNSINKSASVLNSSTASVTSRSSTPARRPSTSKPSPTSRPVPLRSQTPAKARPLPFSPAAKTMKSHNSRPQTLTNSNPTLTSSSPRLHSRSSTPVRKPINPLPTPTIMRTASVGRARIPSSPAAQPSSPRPHACTRAPVHPIDIPDSPNNALPNLRTKLPERAASVGRVCPGGALTIHANLNSQNVVSPSSRPRHSLPIGTHSRLPENSPKAQLKSYGHQAAPSQTQKSVVSEGGVRRISNGGGSKESGGFGRNISKVSLDMALRHMDIKQSVGGSRGTSLVPRSIGSNSRPRRISDPVVPVGADEEVATRGSAIASPAGDKSASDHSPQQAPPLISRENNPDLYGSTRYDAMLLREDSNSLNWLHGAEDKSDQYPEFVDHGFEPLPEPFGSL